MLRRIHAITGRVRLLPNPDTACIPIFYADSVSSPLSEWLRWSISFRTVLEYGFGRSLTLPVTELPRLSSALDLPRVQPEQVT